VVLLVVGGAGYFWWHSRQGESKAGTAEQKPAEEEGSKVTHDDAGRTVVKMDDETQGNLGLIVTKPDAAQLSPELKGYGKVLDPLPLAAVMNELAAADAAFVTSSNELVRQKLMLEQGNTSQSKLQTAESNARRDQLAVQAARDKLALAWGKSVAEEKDLPAFVKPLTEQAAVLVRVDLPVGETLTTPPNGARIAALSGKSAAGQYLGTTANVDPQTLGRGAIFLVKPNTLGLMSGEAVVGYLELPGEPLTGVLVPSEAVILTEGRHWVYIMNSGADAFTRMEVSLEHPAQGGWLVSNGISTNDYMVVTGAQSLLSEEQKASLKAD
jgi:hypothetical protein